MPVSQKEFLLLLHKGNYEIILDKEEFENYLTMLFELKMIKFKGHSIALTEKGLKEIEGQN